MQRKRAAHFINVPEIAYMPINDAAVSALLECGYCVDLYSPLPLPDVSAFGNDVACHPVEYGKRWLAKNIASPRWRQYGLLSATAENPFVIVGAIAFFHRLPYFLLADEIKAGSYWGNAPGYWKKLCLRTLRKAAFCVVNDESRIKVLQDYCGIVDPGRIITYPNGFRDPPPPEERVALRHKWGIPESALLLSVSGNFDELTGAEWLLQAFVAHRDLHLAIQSPQLSAFDRILLSHIEGHDRLFLGHGWVPSYREIWSAAAAMDIGLVIYLNQAPQFQNMGVASNRLCMYLEMGVPVIASRQPSFAFIEEYECGALVSDTNGFAAAVERIAAKLPEMRENARRCAREYIRAPERYRTLRDRIAALACR